MHIEFLRLPRDTVRSKTKQFVSPSRKGPAQRSVLVKDVLTKDNVITLEYFHALLTSMQLIFMWSPD